jgi:hypothetical protein
VAAKRSYQDRGIVTVDDPKKIAWISKMQRQADRDVDQMETGEHGRPRGGRRISFWADAALQARLEAIDAESPGTVAKELVRSALGLTR